MFCQIKNVWQSHVDWKKLKWKVKKNILIAGIELATSQSRANFSNHGPQLYLKVGKLQNSRFWCKYIRHEVHEFYFNLKKTKRQKGPMSTGFKLTTWLPRVRSCSTMNHHHWNISFLYISSVKTLVLLQDSKTKREPIIRLILVALKFK